jgi:hypothetical protein
MEQAGQPVPVTRGRPAELDSQKLVELGTRESAVPARTIERHYGTLLDGVQAGPASRPDALEAELERAAEAEAGP